MTKGKIIIISGPSGSGKTTLHKRLLLSRRLKGKLLKSVSVTTRSMRPGEKNGRDYLFVSRKKFLAQKRAGHFLEWQKVFDNDYGTPKAAVRKLLRQGKSVLLCIDVKGAKVVLRQHPDAVRIFIQAPSGTVLQKRLKKRGSENKKDLHLRLRIAKREMKEAKNYRHIIVNDNLQRAAKRLETVVYQEVEKG